MAGGVLMGGFGGDQFDMTPFGGSDPANREAEEKLRILAQQDSILQSIFFTEGQIRWFDRYLEPNYLKLGRCCVAVTRVSTLFMQCKETSTASSLCNLEQPWVQFLVYDLSAARAKAAARAILNWATTRIDLSSTVQFDSPPLSPKRRPNRPLNFRSTRYFGTTPPAYVEQVDIRIFDLQE
jgi:hypothetical protein